MPDAESTRRQIEVMQRDDCDVPGGRYAVWLVRARARRQVERAEGLERPLDRHPITLVPTFDDDPRLVPVVADELLIDRERLDEFAAWLREQGFERQEECCGSVRLRAEHPVADRVLRAARREEPPIPVVPNVAYSLSQTMKGGNSPEIPEDRVLAMSRDLRRPGGGLGAGVTVVVIDTGLARDAARRSDEFMEPTQEGHVDPLDVVDWLGGGGVGGDGFLDLGAGHGTFAAGVVRQVAPQADIRHLRVLDTDGYASECDIADAIREAGRILAERRPDRKGVAGVLNLSLGMDAVDPDRPAPAIRCALDELRETAGDVLVVAAAGNDGIDRPLFPAAFDDVVGVSSIRAGGDGKPEGSVWARSGCWVDASAVGEGIRSAFVHGIETPGDAGDPSNPYDPDPDDFRFKNPVALWTGTSFSTPQISGWFACHLSAKPEDGSGDARDALAAAGTPVDGYGTAIRLLPGTPS